MAADAVLFQDDTLGSRTAGAGFVGACCRDSQATVPASTIETASDWVIRLSKTCR